MSCESLLNWALRRRYKEVRTAFIVRNTLNLYVVVDHCIMLPQPSYHFFFIVDANNGVIIINIPVYVRVWVCAWVGKEGIDLPW